VLQDRTYAKGVPTPPGIFDEQQDIEEDDYFRFPTRDALGGGSRRGARRAGEISRRTGAWLGRVLRGLLPERKPAAMPSLPESKPRLLVPARLLIAVGVVAVLGLLALSLAGLPGSPKKTANINVLMNQAQQ